MKILVANPARFLCWRQHGDRMPRRNDPDVRGPKIFVYHEIVHNKYVVERFTKQRRDLREFDFRSVRSGRYFYSQLTASRPKSRTSKSSKTANHRRDLSVGD